MWPVVSSGAGIRHLQSQFEKTQPLFATIHEVYYISCIPRAIFREHGNQVGVTLLRHTVNGWQVMLLAACAAKCEVKSRVPEWWKESFVGSADWCIPVGPGHSLVWRESFDSGVTIGTVSLPNIFKQLSVLRGISEVERRTVPLMAVTHAVFFFFVRGH